MKLPFVDKIAKKFTKSASEQVKIEAKKTIIDLLPGLLAIGGMIFGITVFHESNSDHVTIPSNPRPYSSSTRITTNNYFLGDVSDDIIKKILEDKR